MVSSIFIIVVKINCIKGQKQHRGHQTNKLNWNLHLGLPILDEKLSDESHLWMLQMICDVR